MRSGPARLARLLLPAVIWTGAAAAVGADGARLVFGSFMNPDNAHNWALRVGQLLDAEVVVEPVSSNSDTWYRVASAPLAAPALADLERRAARQGLRHWRLAPGSAAGSGGLLPGRPTNPQEPERHRPPGRAVELTEEAVAARPRPAPAAAEPGAALDLDLGLQARTYAHAGLDGQNRFQPSASVRLEYYRSWNRDRQSVTVTPFVRLDVEDEERTHFDFRELFVSHVGDTWDFHLGVKRVFWGVTEFKHLVDVINQTDLVENIDGEDKLGQPMAHLSLVRDWGIVDAFLLLGARERTFPGRDGRLRSTVLVDTDRPLWESGAENRRVDAALRWSHLLGPVELGLYHFSGTSRDPQFVPAAAGDPGALVLRPRYPVVDQSGLDAQAILGDWAWKLEAISNSGHGDRYTAFNFGFERTLVGVLGSRADLGLVAEYLFDDRDAAAVDTLFEHDLALGTRWALNDVADTQALIGVIWDVDTAEFVFSVEGSRRLGDTWTLLLEGRAFGGAERPDPAAPLQSLLDPDNRSGPLQRDDYVQLELTRFF